MKKLSSILSLLFCGSVKSQCPQWLNSVGDATIIVTKTERYCNVTLLAETDHQAGTSYFFRDKNKTVVVSIKPNETIKIKGNIADLQKLLDEYFKDVATDCIESKGVAYVEFKNMKIVLQSDSYNPRAKQLPQGTIWITKE